MKILVTGALRVVVTHLARILRRCGHEVWLAALPHLHDPHCVRCDVGSFRQAGTKNLLRMQERLGDLDG